MSDEITNVPTGQSGDLAGSAVSQNANSFQQASVNNQSSEPSWDERKKEILAEAYRQTQSLISKSENRTSSNMQSMIDKFKADFGVTLTPEQVQEMTQNQAQKSLPNTGAVAQPQTQKAPVSDPNLQGFLYYHGMDPNSPNASYYRQMYEIQNTLGVQLEKSDEEYQKFLHPAQKYKPSEFINAWKQACIDKMVRLKSAQQTVEDKTDQTNMGQMPLVGSRGRKSSTYDSKRSAKSYISQYMNEKKL